MSNYTKELHRANDPIKDDMGYCLAKPGDRVRITKTHRAGKNQYSACEGDTFVITKVVDGQILYGRWLQPSGVLAASELKLDPNCCVLIAIAPEECGAPAGSTELTTLRSVTIDVSDPKTAHKAVDDACAEYQANQKIHWSNAEVTKARKYAMEMMIVLCGQGVSMTWKICSQPKDQYVSINSYCGSPDTFAKAHGYSVNYAKVTFTKNAEFNEWIGKCVCLCILMSRSVPGFVMRGSIVTECE